MKFRQHNRVPVVAVTRRRKNLLGIHRAGRFEINILQDAFPVEQIGQTGDSAQMRTRSEREQQSGFPSQQPRHLFLFGGANSAVQEGRCDRAIRHRLDILSLEVQSYGPEDDVNRGNDVQNGLG